LSGWRVINTISPAGCEWGSNTCSSNPKADISNMTRPRHGAESLRLLSHSDISRSCNSTD
jgi:hypothetical protein